MGRRDWKAQQDAFVGAWCSEIAIECQASIEKQVVAMHAAESTHVDPCPWVDVWQVVEEPHAQLLIIGDSELVVHWVQGVAECCSEEHRALVSRIVETMAALQ
eukprot:11192366-Karenia_brevis.AAC.1